MGLDLKPLSTNDGQQLLGTSFILRSTQFTEVLGEDTKQRRVKWQSHGITSGRKAWISTARKDCQTGPDGTGLEATYWGD